MYNTATSFATMLFENKFGQLDQKEFILLQYQRGYFMFKQR